ncbi:MAG: hypothetical protein ABIO72_04225 [Patescibacteria group bacterium]
MERNPFQRIVLETDLKKTEPKTEFIKTPKFVEEELFKSPEAPVSLVCTRLLELGVPEEEVKKYTLAVKAYFDGSSQASKKERYSFTKERVNFSSQEYHFGPRLTFDESAQIFPPALEALNSKPRLTHDPDQELKTKTITGEEAIAALQGSDPKREVLSPQERFFTKLNRLMYAFHEPIHVMQASAQGDVINRLLMETHGWDIVDPEHARAFLQTHQELLAGSNVAESIPMPEGLEESILGLPDGLPRNVEPLPKRIVGAKSRAETVREVNEANEIRNKARKVGFYLDSQFEASMDILAEDGMKSYLEQKPALMFWCHNSISSVVAGLRTLKKQFENGDFSVGDEAVLMKAAAIVRIISPAYFSVFHDSSEFQPYAEKAQSRPVLLNRFLSGEVVTIPTFTRMEIENLLRDCGLLNQSNPFTPRSGYTSRREELLRYDFPLSGKSFYATKEVKPFTDEGAQLAAQIVTKGAEKGWTLSRLQELFDRLQMVLEESLDASSKDLTSIQEEIKNSLSLRLTDAELKELFGISAHLVVKLGPEYHSNFVLSKRARPRS